MFIYFGGGVCVCVREREREREKVYIYIYIYVCVCASEWERQTDSERERSRDYNTFFIHSPVIMIRPIWFKIKVVFQCTQPKTVTMLSTQAWNLAKRLRTKILCTDQTARCKWFVTLNASEKQRLNNAYNYIYTTKRNDAIDYLCLKAYCAKFQLLKIYC